MLTSPCLRFVLGVLLFGSSAFLPGCAQRSFLGQTLAPAAVATHRTVAILPFSMELERLRDIARGVRAGKWSDSALDSRLGAARRQLGYQLQAALHAELLRQHVLHPTVAVQGPAETNQRLRHASLTYESLSTRSPTELRAILGVDALLTGQTALHQLLPGSLSLALFVLNDNINPMAENTVSTQLASYDTQTGQLAWQFDHELRGKPSVSAKALARKLVRTMRNTFPYGAP